MNTFLPEGYKVPEASSGYMRLKQGENKFRVLDSAIVGWELWIDDEDGNRKPLRFKSEQNIPADRVGEPRKHFWAFPVWNYQEEQVQVLELTQKGIMKSIRSLTQDEDWGHPETYDIVITRQGEGLETEYEVKSKPKTKLDEGVKVFYKDLDIKLERLYDGGDPFSKEMSDEELTKIAKEIDEDLPFS